MRHIPIPDAGIIAAAYVEPESNPFWRVVYAVAERHARTKQHGNPAYYAGGFADAWVYCHTYALRDARSASGDPVRPTGSGLAEVRGVQGQDPPGDRGGGAGPGRPASDHLRAPDTDPGRPGAEVDAFADTAAHNIANVYASRAHAGTPIEAIADDYAYAYEVAVDRLRSLAAGRSRSGPDRSRDRDGGAS